MGQKRVPQKDLLAKRKNRPKPFVPRGCHFDSWPYLLEPMLRAFLESLREEGLCRDGLSFDFLRAMEPNQKTTN